MYRLRSSRSVRLSVRSPESKYSASLVLKIGLRGRPGGWSGRPRLARLEPNANVTRHPAREPDPRVRSGGPIGSPGRPRRGEGLVAAAAQGRGDGEQQDLEVRDRPHLLDVLEVHVGVEVHHPGAAARDLPQAGEARLHDVALVLPGLVAGDDLDQLRARARRGSCRRTTTFQNWGSSSRLHFRRKRPTRVWRGSSVALVGLAAVLRARARLAPAVLAHGAELVDVELAVVAPDPALPEEHRRAERHRAPPARPAPVSGSSTTKMQNPTTRSNVGFTHADVDAVRALDDHVVRFGRGDRQPALVPVASAIDPRARDRHSSCWPRHFFDRGASAPEAFPLPTPTGCDPSARSGELSTDRARGRDFPGTRTVHAATSDANGAHAPRSGRRAAGGS